jgi:5-methylcytosine-specific restriction endonuclease McrA
MHAECWSRKRSQLKDSVHLAMTAHYKSIGAKCARCGSTENVTADHIISREDGGTNHPWNYQPLCGSCNSSKK